MVGKISTWIIAALRDEQFFSLSELNRAIREKLELFNSKLFQKKDGSRLSLFLGEEKPLLAPLPATRFELADWKQATVQFNYHISVDGMLYSVPYEYIKKKVDVRVTDTTIEVFYNQNRIASHRRLTGRPGQYDTFWSICRRIIKNILNGMATVSVNGLRGSALTRIQPWMPFLPPSMWNSRPIGVVWDFLSFQNGILKQDWKLPAKRH